MMQNMMGMKQKLIDELSEHLSSSQMDDLMQLINDKKEPGMGDSVAKDGDPKGVAIEKVSIMGKPARDGMDEEAGAGEGDEDAKLKADLGIGAPHADGVYHGEEGPGAKLADHGEAGAEDEMSDEELKELLSKYLK